MVQDLPPSPSLPTTGITAAQSATVGPGVSPPHSLAQLSAGDVRRIRSLVRVFRF